jgi:putative sterol carrier protein
MMGPTEQTDRSKERGVAELDFLREADRDEAAAYFSEVDPELLVAEIAALGDEELLEILKRDQVRPAAVEGVLSRLEEFAISERLADVHGVVRFDLQRREVLLERHALRFAGGHVVPLPHVDDDVAPDVVLRTSLLRFVRLVSGERNAGLEYLSGKLDIEGDAGLALAVGGLFRVPGTGAVAVDPTTLDPVDVATALKGVPGDHLRRVMSGGFRPVVLGEVFRRLPDFVDPGRAAKADLSIGFRLTGHPSGEVERYVVEIRGGLATVTGGAESAEGERRDATVTVAGHDFLRLATGHLSAVTGVLKGQLKVKGDKAKALQLVSLLDIPKAR